MPKNGKNRFSKISKNREKFEKRFVKKNRFLDIFDRFFHVMSKF